MIMNLKTFRDFTWDVQLACSHIRPIDMRKVIYGNMMIEAVKSMHLEKTENSNWCIIKDYVYYKGSQEESSKYGYRDYLPSVEIVTIDREEIFKDKIIGYLDKN